MREITKRLNVGLAQQIPDGNARLEHILKNQVFGVGITELTSLMARRTLYCSKHADGEHSVVKMGSEQGNLIYKRLEHSFKNDRCTECSASAGTHGRGTETENYAYALIHKSGLEQIKKELGMKFDVVVGNPPYQMDGGGGGQNDSPIYQHFVEGAISLSPKYITMVIPSRWMAGGRGLDDFRARTLADTRFEKLIDFPNPDEVFPAVSNKGGVCYFLWNSEHKGLCEVTQIRDGKIESPVKRDLNEFDVFVRNSGSLPILKKVLNHKSFVSIEGITSADTPFGLASNFTGYKLSGTGKDSYKLLVVSNMKRNWVWVPKSTIQKNTQDVDSWKVFLPIAGSGMTQPDSVIGGSEIGEPGTVCTQTFRYFGPISSELEAKNLQAYLKTKFCRFMINLRKGSQNTYKSTFKWVPKMDFTRNWTDEELFHFFEFSKSEIALIEESIKESI